MARICPVTGDKVLYLSCLECENKICRTSKNERTIQDEQKLPAENTCTEDKKRQNQEN